MPAVAAARPQGSRTSPQEPQPKPSVWVGPPGVAPIRVRRRRQSAQIRWRCNTASTRRSWLPLPEPPLQQPAQPAQLLITEVLVGDQLGEQHLGRAIEHLVNETAEGAAAGGLALHQGPVAVRPPL